MKLLLTNYVGSLKERGELDAILPDLLSELGFHVISRPAIGAVQRGVDIAAVRKDEDGELKIFLFSVKAGDLTRAEWNGSKLQALRPSLEEILDDYIPSHIPPQYKELKIVICLVIGGVVQQVVQPLVVGFMKTHTTDKISFREWNGDRVAELLLAGPLREKLLPKALQSSFQKAVAMVDEPDVSYDHFARLLLALRALVSKDRGRVLVARQIYICLWVLFVWAREIDNLDAPYRASELALLHVWELVKPFIGKKGAQAAAVGSVLHHLVLLHVTIGGLFLEKILPFVGRQHALSLAVSSGEPTDVNLKMFDVLGRLALTGHWMIWLGQVGGRELNAEQIAGLRNHVNSGLQMIVNNPCLHLPLMDEQAIELALFLGLAAQMGHADSDIKRWLAEMMSRLSFAVNSHGRYPTVLRNYTDLITHPKAQTNEYRQEVTPGSVLVPLLLAWVTALNDQESIASLMTLKAGPLAHCTLQLWLPDEETETHLYLNDAIHGAALAELPITNGGRDLLKVLAEATSADSFKTCPP